MSERKPARDILGYGVKALVKHRTWYSRFLFQPRQLREPFTLDPQGLPNTQEPADQVVIQEPPPLDLSGTVPVATIAQTLRNHMVSGSEGLVARQVRTACDQEVLLAYVKALSDDQVLSEQILKPLMEADLRHCIDLNQLSERLIVASQVWSVQNSEDVLMALPQGTAAIFLGGQPGALLIAAGKAKIRGVEKPTAEMVVRGPQEGLSEPLSTNLSLLRRRMDTRQLVVEEFQVGETAPRTVAVLSVRGVSNPRILAEAKRRIKAIKIDTMQDSGELQQFIEDHPNSIYPTVMATERPDRLAAQLMQGYVGVLLDGSPFALVLPGHYTLLLESAEDRYLRRPYGTLVRLIRNLAYYLAVFMPAVYIAIMNFHQELLPTDLLLAIAASRETVPFPSVLEVTLMEIAFDLIREAGVRVPSVMGQTIGIVGALILGQAAVQANIVSPISVIVVATTGLASYVIPNYDMAFAARIQRFGYLAASSAFGLVGFASVFAVHLTYVASMKSFGVPYFAPESPRLVGRTRLARAPIYEDNRRAVQLRPQDITRQGGEQRPWAPENRRN